MNALRSIVVGLDFSECSRVALGHAQRDVHASLVEYARRRWATFVEGLAGAHDPQLNVCVAPRLAGIRRQLERWQADLLVLGAYGARKPHVGMGTLASGCIRGVPTDVLIVRDTHRDPFRTVVVGIDFSVTCQRALDAAALVAHREGAKLHAVHVEPASVDTYARLRGDLGSQLEAFAKATTDRYPGLEAHTDVFPYSGYRSGIIEFAALVTADLVAIGTRGRTNLRDVVLGSTAEKVVRDSTCAVWAAKPQP